MSLKLFNWILNSFNENFSENKGIKKTKTLKINF